MASTFFLVIGLLTAYMTVPCQSFLQAVHPDKPISSSVDPSSYFQLPKPSQDSWYLPPPGWESESPGTVLRVRDHAYKGPKGIPDYYDVFQVLYRTTDSHSRPNYAATTVFIPESHKTCAETFRNVTEPKNCSYALLSYQLPYDSACFDASPSYNLQIGEPYGDIGIMLRRGYFVSVPDYEGPRASYGASILAGFTILDQFRALKATLGDYGFQTNVSRFAMWGYSSGGTATEFAAELAAQYAPDVKLVGTVIGGLAGNVSVSLDIVNAHDVAGLLVHGLVGLTKEYPEQRKFLDSRLKKEGMYNISEFYLAQQLTGSDGLAQYLYQDIYEYFQDGRNDVFAPTMMVPLNREGLAGLQGTPNMPVFLYQAVRDEMCPIEYVDPVVQRHCENSGNIWYQRNMLGAHNLEGSNGRQRGLDFLTDVVEGTNITGRPETGCKIEDGTWDYDIRIPYH